MPRIEPAASDGGDAAAVTAARHRARDVRAAGDRGVHRRSARAAPDLAADELQPDRDRAAARAARGSEIGWAGRETLGDLAHAYIYAQRTADDRIAIGGRGVPYRYGSRTDHDGRTHDSTVAALQQILHRLLPVTRDAAIDHAWSGVLAVPRDWCSTAGLDRRTGLGWAGGYVGHGVATTNLAGRTLRDLVLGAGRPT